MNFRESPRSLPVVLAALAMAGPALAADHIEAPLSSADAAADIADFYAWPTDDGKIVAIVTAAGAGSSAAGAVYDPDVLYGLHIDNTGDAIADMDVWMRFGQNSAGEWGLQVIDLPGGDAEVSGPVETVLDAGGGLHVWAGQAEDPFFFDLEGYNDTLANGHIIDMSTGGTYFDPTRDFFAGLNVTAVAVEMSAGAVVDAAHDMQIWATTSRK